MGYVLFRPSLLQGLGRRASATLRPGPRFHQKAVARDVGPNARTTRFSLRYFSALRRGRAEKSSYQYNTLPGPRFIRTLKFLDFSPPEPASTISINGLKLRFPTRGYPILRFALETVDLDSKDRPPYSALSYTWGTPISRSSSTEGLEEDEDYEMKKLIELNNASVSITRNLHDALMHLTSWTSSRSQRYWIDALCINQNDVAERNAQVTMMADIYAEAESVVAWIGKTDEQSTVAIPLIHRMHQKIVSLSDAERAEPYPVDDPLTFQKLGFDAPLTSEQWLSIIALFSRNWFHRVWVIQEAALARELKIICGTFIIDLDVLVSFASWVHHHDWVDQVMRRPELSKMEKSKPGMQRLIYMNHLSSLLKGEPGTLSDLELVPNVSSNLEFITDRLFGIRQGEKLGVAFLAWLVHRNRHFDATDSRDKIYAPLSLAARATKDDRLDMIIPDYSVSTTDVFMNFTRFVISQTPNLAMLSLVGHIKPSADLPSWTPDFNRGTSTMLASYEYRATEGWPEEKEHQGATFPSPEMLQVKGVYFDKIVERGTSLLSIFRLVERLPSTDERAGRTNWEVLLRTLTGERFIITGGNFVWCQDILTQETHWLQIQTSFLCWLLWNASQTITISEHQKFLEVGEAEKWFSLYEKISQAWGIEPYTVHRQHGMDLWSFLLEHFRFMSSNSPKDEASRQLQRQIEERARLFMSLAEHHSYFGVVARTAALNQIALVPGLAEMGDEIWFLRGARVPFVLRRQVTGRYTLVGEAFVHGCMRGEFIQEKISDSARGEPHSAIEDIILE